MTRTKKAAQRRKHHTRLRAWCREHGVSFEEAAMNDDGPPPAVWYPNRRARGARDKAKSDGDGGDSGNGRDGVGGGDGGSGPPPPATLTTVSNTGESAPPHTDRRNPRGRPQLPPLVVEIPRVPVATPATVAPKRRVPFNHTRKREKLGAGARRPGTRLALAGKCMVATKQSVRQAVKAG